MMRSLLMSLLREFSRSGKNSHDPLDTFQSGVNLMKIKGISWQLHVLQMARLLVLFLCGIVAACFLFVQSFVLLFTHLHGQVEGGGGIRFDFLVLFCLVLMVISIGGIYLALNQKRWMKLFGIFEQIDELERSHASSAAKREDGQEGTNDELKRMIAKMVEEAINKQTQS